MDYLYMLLNLGSISIPFLFSFHPRLKFYRYWKALIIAMLLTMVVFIPWDIWFTHEGYWGFNAAYFLDTKLFGLPIEEWLFFICIPYACVFTHYALLHYFPNTKLSKKQTYVISVLLWIILAITLILNTDKWYPVINFGYALLLIPIALKYNTELMQRYFLTFLIMLIPFFIVNGILTGSFIDDQVVWYNNDENLSIRMFTIPIEDSIYAFTMILSNLVLTEYFMKRFKAKKNAV